MPIRGWPLLMPTALSERRRSLDGGGKCWNQSGTSGTKMVPELVPYSGKIDIKTRCDQGYGTVMNLGTKQKYFVDLMPGYMPLCANSVGQEGTGITALEQIIVQAKADGGL